MVKKITLSFKKRTASERGISRSNLINDLINEVSHDLINLSREWNSIAYPIFGSLPQGASDTRWDLDSTLNPVVNGLDGTQMFMDNNANSTLDDGRYYNSTNERPKTLKEIAEALQSNINEINEAVQLIEILGGEGLTEEQKAKIGLNIFNPFQASASDSIDGRSKRNEFNVIQLAKDIYGATFALDGNGEPNLSNSMRDMLDALLELHDGDFDNDITLQHQINNDDIIAGADIEQTKVDQSASYVVLNRSASVDTLEDDLNRLRYEVGILRGNNNWEADFSGIPYAGAPISLKGHVEDVGTGIPSAINPHGLAPADIGLTTILSAVVTFTGMDNDTDSTPDYTSNNYININDPLETALGKLDTALQVVDTENDAHRAIVDGNPHGVDMDNFPSNDVVDRINLASNYISADRITDGVTNIIPTAVQEQAWDNHLTTLSGAHQAIAIDVNDVNFDVISGSTSQEVFENIDAQFEENRLEITYVNHTDEQPIIVTHNRGRYPLVQLVDTSLTDYEYVYGVSALEGIAIYVNVEHLDTNTFRVWTNSTEGTIVALF